MKHKTIKQRLKEAAAKRPPLHEAGTLSGAVRRGVKRGFRKHRPLDGPLEAIGSLPRITNETVAEHREEVLRGARKYIYPLQHSRDRIIKISIWLGAAAVVAFFVYCGLALYRFQSRSTFIYEVTRVLPFPVAKAGPSYVAYENYLFELRHLTHYYTNQAEHEDFSDKKYAGHLEQLKKQSMQKVVDDAFVKQLAAKNNITVSNREVSDKIALVKAQNRLGSSDEMLADVLSQFWGWSISDFRRELKTQLLEQKVVSRLDSAAHARADNALAEVRSGTDFAAVAARYSDDPGGKGNGGLYPAPVGRTSRDVPPAVIDALQRLKPGEVSDVIETSGGLEIVKNISVTGDKIQAAQIYIRLKPIEDYIRPLKQEQKTRHFISV